jgi:hypothetical protein
MGSYVRLEMASLLEVAVGVSLAVVPYYQEALAEGSIVFVASRRIVPYLEEVLLKGSTASVESTAIVPS